MFLSTCKEYMSFNQLSTPRAQKQTYLGFTERFKMSQKEAKKSDEKESIDLSESLSKEDKILECAVCLQSLVHPGQVVLFLKKSLNHINA